MQPKALYSEERHQVPPFIPGYYFFEIIKQDVEKIQIPIEKVQEAWRLV